MKKVKLNLETVTMQDLTKEEQNLYNREAKKVSKMRTEKQLRHHVHNAGRMKNQRNSVIAMLAVVTVHTIKAKLGMSSKELEYIGQSETMQQAQVDNTKHFFDIAFVKLGAWKDANKEVRDAMLDVTNGVKDGEKRKLVAFRELKKILKQALNYVNDIVLNDQLNAPTVIANARMIMIASGTINVPDLRIIKQKGSGSVKLMSITYKVGGKKAPASYEFAYSADNGVTWIPICTIPKASFIVKGLPTNVPLLFRKRVTPGDGVPTAWVVSKPTLVN